MTETRTAIGMSVIELVQRSCDSPECRGSYVEIVTISTGEIVDENAMDKFLNECTICGSLASLPHPYPYTTSRPLDVVESLESFHKIWYNLYYKK